jgi:LDH2 family malate/lactate/ureidoglycolate dehydrogenase
MVAKIRGVDAGKLVVFTERVLQRVGLPEEDAKTTAQMIVDCDLRGIDSHGVNHLKGFYVKGIQNGFINLHPKTEIFSVNESTAVMEADRGLGFVVGFRAMMEAIRRAREVGIGLVAVRNNTHMSNLSAYSMLTLEHGMIGIAMAQTGPQKEVVLPGSKVRGVGNNPISVAIPAGRKPAFVLDMATSVVSWGKLELAQMNGTTMPEGWVVDSEGKPITDPNKVESGKAALLPLGGTPSTGSYKGFGLAVLVDILCGVLSGGRVGLLAVNEGRGVNNPGHSFFGAIRIDGFLPVDKFKETMDETIEAYEALPTIPGVKKVYIAGGLEAEIAQERKANGIPLNPKIVHELKELAEELGVEYDL